MKKEQKAACFLLVPCQYLKQHHYQLDELQSQLWEYAYQAVSLQEIARQLSLPVTKVQQIAFRLWAAGPVAVLKETHGQFLR